MRLLLPTEQHSLRVSSKGRGRIMDFGMPTLIENDDLNGCVSLCKQLGLDFVELNMNLPQYQLDALDADRLNDIRKSRGIYFTVHLDENLNVCDFNPLVSDAYTETTLGAVKLAKQIEAPILNMHMSKGVYFTLPDRKVFLFERYNEFYLKSLLEFRRKCEGAIGDSGVKICIENSNGYENFSRQGIELLLESKVFSLTFDTGHNHCIGCADEEFILSHKQKLCHMHLHDAVGKKDHLPLGDGEINIREKLDLAKECSCRVVLETKTVDGLCKTVQRLSDYM